MEYDVLYDPLYRRVPDWEWHARRSSCTLVPGRLGHRTMRGGASGDRLSRASKSRAASYNSDLGWRLVSRRGRPTLRFSLDFAQRAAAFIPRLLRLSCFADDRTGLRPAGPGLESASTVAAASSRRETSAP